MQIALAIKLAHTLLSQNEMLNIILLNLLGFAYFNNHTRLINLCMFGKLLYMNKDLQKLIQDHPIFTSKEARKRGIHPSILAYYIKQGTLERVSRGLYRNPNHESNIPTPWEDLVITANSIPEGVVCLISALNLYEMTDEFNRENWIAVPKSSWPKRRRHTRIVRLSNMTLGKVKMKMGSETIWIFDKERTVIDSFRYLSIEIAIKALKAYLQSTKDHQPDFNKLSKYGRILRKDITPYILALTT